MSRIKAIDPSVSPNLPYILAIALAVVIGSLDIYIASLPTLVKEFATTHEMANFTISINGMGGALLSPFYGPLCDHFGRRRLLLIALSQFGLFSLASAVTTSLP